MGITIRLRRHYGEVDAGVMKASQDGAERRPRGPRDNCLSVRSFDVRSLCIDGQIRRIEVFPINDLDVTLLRELKNPTGRLIVGNTGTVRARYDRDSVEAAEAEVAYHGVDVGINRYAG